MGSSCNFVDLRDRPFFRFLNHEFIRIHSSASAPFVGTLSHHTLQKREGRWRKFVSGLVMLGLGLLLLFAPDSFI